jgi:hypothetical protein
MSENQRPTEADLTVACDTLVRCLADTVRHVHSLIAEHESYTPNRSYHDLIASTVAKKNALLALGKRCLDALPQAVLRLIEDAKSANDEPLKVVFHGQTFTTYHRLASVVPRMAAELIDANISETDLNLPVYGPIFVVYLSRFLREDLPLNNLTDGVNRESALARQQLPLPDDDRAFIPASQCLDKEIIRTHKKLLKVLDDNDQIQRRKPSPQRLEVHAGDLARWKHKQYEAMRRADEPVADALADAYDVGFADGEDKSQKH